MRDLGELGQRRLKLRDAARERLELGIRLFGVLIQPPQGCRLLLDLLGQLGADRPDGFGHLRQGFVDVRIARARGPAVSLDLFDGTILGVKTFIHPLAERVQRFLRPPDFLIESSVQLLVFRLNPG